MNHVPDSNTRARCIAGPAGTGTPISCPAGVYGSAGGLSTPSCSGACQANCWCGVSARPGLLCFAQCPSVWSALHSLAAQQPARTHVRLNKSPVAREPPPSLPATAMFAAVAVLRLLSCCASQSAQRSATRVRCALLCSSRLQLSLLLESQVQTVQLARRAWLAPTKQ